MSLVVWLPLNGDVHNQGIFDTNIINYGATISNDGKIGQCYSFDGSDDYISIDSEELRALTRGGDTPMSIATWVYHADDTRGIIFGDYGVSGYINFNIEVTVNHTARFYWGATPDYTIPAMNVGANTWSHICFTYNGTELRGYLNGTEVYTSMITLNVKTKTAGVYQLGRDIRTGTTALNGMLNDFRIYNHCLSAAEVHEIAQGLLIHYKLNGQMGGNNPNLLNGTLTNRLASADYTNTRKIGQFAARSGGDGVCSSIEDSTVPIGRYAFSIQNNTTGNRDFVQYGGDMPFALTEGQNYTISAYYKGTGTALIRIWDLTNNVSAMTYSTALPESAASDWTRISCTFVATAVMNTNNIGCCIGIKGASSVLICGFKFEVGSEATPYCCSLWDLGIDSTIIEDSSGYGYNGVVYNNIQFPQDSPRYDYSTFFGTNATIQISNIYTTGFSNSYTFAWWAKISQWQQNMMWGFENGTRLNGMYYHRTGVLTWNTGDGANNPLYNYGTTTNVSLPSTNVWHHYAMVSNGTQCLVYLDGELWAQAKTYKILSNTAASLYLNGWNSTFNYTYDDSLYLSDFRFYSTALLDNDIKSLYNLGMKIDNKGGIHTFEVRETLNDALLKVGTIQETSTQVAKLKYKGWQSPNFIEI